MERRVFLAILLSFAVLYTYQALFVRAPQPKAGEAAVAGGAASQPAAPAQTQTVAESTSGSTGVATSAGVPVLGDTRERQIVVETQDAEIVLSNKGARVLHWRLKRYDDGKGATLDLVPSGLPADEATPFVLQVADPGLSRRLQEALYQVSGDAGGRVDATKSPGTLVFEFKDTEGLSVRKSLEFQPSRYLVRFSSSVQHAGTELNPILAWGPGLGDVGATTAGGSFFTGNYVQPPQAIFHTGEEVERHTRDELASLPPFDRSFRFVGVDDHYFIAAALNSGPAKARYRSVTLAGTDQSQRGLLAFDLAFSSPAKDVQFFVGPKQFDVLQSVDAEFVRAINFGRLAFLVVPLLGALKWLFGFFGNYGWSIIVLTILLNLAMFPLRHKASVAMRKMQQVQPLMKAIQDRYAHLKMTDPARQKMNEEISALYRDKGVNPASGCVPTLLTFPVLFAFYSLLSQSIELRGAPFVGWLHDLSGADPYYVLPILMGATMVWQQRLTPASVDPAQQRVMMVMPLVFTVTMLFSASGVVLYWFVSQLWAIGQQYFTNWMIGPAVPARAAAAAGRK